MNNRKIRRYALLGIIVLTLPFIGERGRVSAQVKVTVETEGKLYAPLPDTAYILNQLNGYNELALKNPDSALLIFENLLAQSSSIKFHYGMAVALLKISSIHKTLGSYEEALQACGEAIFYLRQSDAGRRLLAFSYNHMGVIYKSLGENLKASQFFHLAIRTIEQFPESTLSLASVYSNISSLITDDSLSLHYLYLSDSIARATKNYRDLGLTLINIALRYNRMNDPGQSRAYLQKAYELGQDQNDTLLQFRALVKFGDLAMVEGEAQQALFYVRNAYRLRPDGDPDVFQQNANQYLMGHIYLKLKNYEKAESHFREALKTSRELAIKDQVAEIHSSLSDLYAARHDYAKAFAHLSLFTRLKDSVTNHRVAKDIHQLEVKYRTAEKDRLIARAQQQSERKNLLIAGIAAVLLLFYWYSRQQRKLLRQKQEIGKLKSVMKGEEKERGRIARELHDGIGGMLGAVKMQASRMKEYQSPAEFRELMEMIDETALEVRRTSHNLLPDILEKHTLEEALTLYCSAINKNAALRIELDFHGETTDLDKSVKLIIYRMAQELIQNMTKHAHATVAFVQVMRIGNLLSLTVEDNGVGFDTGKARSGIGLMNLTHRVQALKGYMSINSIEGESTVVFIEFDLEKLKLEDS